MTKLLILIVGLISVVSLPARTFTSAADKSKTVEAELIDYLPSSDQVVIRHKGANRNMTVAASSFSSEDQDYFKEYLKESTKRKSLEITAEEEGEKMDKKEGSIYTYEKTKKHFKINLSNSGSVEIEKLKVKYDIYVSRFNKDGDKITDVVSGEHSIATISSKSDEYFETLPVELTLGCETSSSCPKCKTHAASVQKERIIGIHVRMHDDEGKLITEFYSSSSVKSAAQKKAKSLES